MLKDENKKPIINHMHSSPTFTRWHHCCINNYIIVHLNTQLLFSRTEWWITDMHCSCVAAKCIYRELYSNWQSSKAFPTYTVLCLHRLHTTHFIVHHRVEVHAFAHSLANSAGHWTFTPVLPVTHCTFPCTGQDANIATLFTNHWKSRQ